jgi:hypothetical protein
MVGDRVVFLQAAIFSADGLSAPIPAGELGGALVEAPAPGVLVKSPAPIALAQRRLLQVTAVDFQPIAVLTAPQDITFCSDLLLDTSLSTGDAGRAFRTEWILLKAAYNNTADPAVTGADLRSDSVEEINQYLNSFNYLLLNGHASSVLLPDKLFPPSYTYHFQAKIRNWLGSVAASETKLVTKVPQPILLPY